MGAEVKVTTHREGDGWGVSVWQGIDSAVLPPFHLQRAARSVGTMLRMAYAADGQLELDSQAEAVGAALTYQADFADLLAMQLAAKPGCTREEDTAREALHIAAKLTNMAGRILTTGIVSDDDRQAIVKASYV